MYCRNCGKELAGDEKFCTGCGAPVERSAQGANSAAEPVGGADPMEEAAPEQVQAAAPVPESKGGKKKFPAFRLLLLLVVLAAAGCLGWLIFREKGGSGPMTDQKRYEITVQIQEGVQEAIAPYLNEEELLDPEEEVVAQAAQAVYAYGQKLEEDGVIAGTAFCEEGQSVSFFLEDGSTTVYFPPIEGYYAGEGDMQIAVWDMTTWQDVQSGFTNPGETISGAVSGFASRTYGNDTTVAELQTFLGSLEENRVRAIFWQGHGGAYTAQNGSIVFAFVLNEKMTEETEERYSQDRQAATEESPTLINVSDGGTYAVNFAFFEKYMSSVDGGLFFSGACKSNADGGIMASTILGKGFDAYVGADDNINQLYSNEVLSETARNLAKLDETGCYMDIETALNQAVEAYEGSLGENANEVLPWSGGRFALTQERVFRLIPPYLEVQLTSSDSSVDWSRISVHCMKEKGDGAAETFRRLNGSELDNGSFAIADVDQTAVYQLEISYDSYPLKTVELDMAGRTFADNVTTENIDVRVANLDIIASDESGAFLSDATVQVTAADDENGQVGLTQEPQVTRNENGESVYRIPVAPGTYTVKAAAEALGEKETTVTVDGDRTLRFSAGDALAAYAQVVQQYEEQYGSLSFWDAGYGIINYQGVFLLEPVDFDQDGVEELIVGYGVPQPYGISDIVWPSLDVWKLENGEPVLAYTGAVITQSDVGRHCAFTQWNGTYYLLTGMDGYETDLSLQAMENGQFVTTYTLQVKEDATGNGMSGFLNGTAADLEAVQETYAQIRAGESYYYMTDGSYGCFNGSIYEDSSYTPEDLVSGMNAVRQRMGLEEISVVYQ